MCGNSIFYEGMNSQARAAPNVGCKKPFDPRSPGSDLNPMIRTDCRCSCEVC